MTFSPPLRIWALLIALTACNNAGGGKIVTPAPSDRRAASEDLAAGWNREQMDETLELCLVKADSSLEERKRNSFCRCIFKEVSKRWTYDVFAGSRDEYFDETVKEKEEACLAADFPDDDIVPENERKWSAEEFDRAKTQCNADVTAYGLGLEDGKVGKTCECLLKEPRATMRFSSFEKTLTTFVKERAGDGGLEECLGAVGFDAGKALAREWRKPSKVAAFDEGSLERASAAFDDDGHIAAVWILSQAGKDPQVWGRVFAKDGGWKAPGHIATAPSFVGFPRIYLEGGVATAYWAELRGDAPVLMKAAFQGDAWGQPAQVGDKSFSNASADGFSFEMSRDGRLLVAYPVRTVAGQIETAIFKDGAWGQTQLIQSPGGDVAQTRVVAGGFGDLMVSFLVKGAKPQLVTSLLKGDQWETGKPADNLNLDGSPVEIAFDRPEALHAVFVSSGQVTGSRYVGLLGWDKPKVVADGTSLMSPRIIAAAAGAAVSVWIDGTKKVSSAQFHPFKGWQKPVAIADATNGLLDLTLVRSQSGRALAIWTEGAGGKSGQVWLAPLE